MKSFYTRFIMLLMIIATLTLTTYAQSFHVVDVNNSKDANPTNNGLPWFPNNNNGNNSYDWGHSDTYYAVLNGIAYFSADDGSHGSELWRSDGTDKGTYMIMDINPGTATSNIIDITISGGKIFFSATNGTNVQEIWTTDGTPQGTQPLVDLGAAGSANPSYLTDVNGTLYFFTDNNYGSQASQLWKTDGTTAGTVMVADFYNSSSFNYASQGRQITNVNGHVFFSMSNYGYANELGFSDGTNAGTIILNNINPFGNGSNPTYLTAFNGSLYFSADDGTGLQLWTSDGTMAGTHKINNANSIYLDGNNTFHFQSIKNSLYFTGFPNWGAQALCKYDVSNAANNVEVVNTISPGPGVNNMYNFSKVNNNIFFSVYNGKDQTLWKTDGTTAGTSQLADINPGGRNIYLYKHFINANGLMLFSFYDDQHGYELWKSDGTTRGTAMVKEINPGPYSAWVNNISYLGKNISLFEAYDGKTGLELWRTDGSEQGTWMVKNINQKNTSSSNPNWLVASSDDESLIFTANDPEYGNELRIADGSGGNARPVKDIYKGSFDSWPSFPTSGRNTTYFFASIDNPVPQQDHGSDIHLVNRFWKTDGTPNGTSMISAPPLEELINNGGYVVGYPSAPVATDNLVYLVIFNSATYLQELWRSDGTTRGTYAIKTDINPYYSIEPTPVGKNLFFASADATGYTYQLWVSDGTVSGTRELSFNGISAPYNLFAFRNKLYFTAYDPVNYYNDLWSADGSASGATILKSVYVASWVPFAKNNDKLFFTASDPNTTAGYELWATDGSSQGTKMLKDIYTGDYYSSYPSMLTGTGSWVYFTATDSAHGYEIWKSDGTSRGTQLVDDITPGSAGSYGITNMVGANNQVYFLNSGSLWASGGTAANTSAVNDKGLNNVCCFSNMTMVGNRLAFTGYSFPYGVEIWIGAVNCSSTRNDDISVPSFLKSTEETDGSTAIYPNPANGVLNVRVASSSIEGQVSITVIDVNGATVASRTLGSGETSTQIHIANLAPGTYFLKISSGNGSVVTVKKFVKM
jgi:ELWxxDGT repeat protein